LKSSFKMNSQELRALQEAYSQVYELDEAEGSYGQTPKAREAMGALANSRRNTPASGFSKRGEKTTKVKSAEKHFTRMGNPDAGNRGKKSTKPDWNSGKRKGMTQSDRDHSRGEAEYGHTGYDPDFNGPANGPGGKPKGKKAERQKKTGVSAESFDLFDYILEYLVAEGYADTNEAAISIMVNMSEDWRESIVEGGFNNSGRYDVGGGRTVGPVAGAVRSLFSGNLPKGQTYVPPSPQKGTNRPPAVPSSKGDSGKLTDFGAGGGKEKMKRTGMTVGQVERQGRMNKGDYSG
jgi:hypothetical protein